MQDYCTVQKDTGVFLANEQKTKWVTIITLITMVIEIAVGYWSGSMALLADGWHMASHSLALILSLIVYYLYRHPDFRASFTFGGGKILSLGGYTSSIFLILIALSMMYESVMHFYKNETVQYDEAIIVAIIGLVVNLICAKILHPSGEGHDHSHSHGHHDHSHCNHGKNKLSPNKGSAHQHGHDHGNAHNYADDYNREGVYIHILTDALTSVFAILALFLGKLLGWTWADPLIGFLGGLVVLKWSIGLVRQSGKDLLDAHDESIDREKLVQKVETDGSKVLDIHLWRVGPGQIGCEMVVEKNHEQRSVDYRNRIQDEFKIHHLIIEVV